MTRQDDFEERPTWAAFEKRMAENAKYFAEAREIGREEGAGAERARILAYLYRAQEEWETALQHESRKAEADDIRKGAHTRTAFEGEPHA